MNEIEEMKADMVGNLAAMMMEKIPGMSIEYALDEIFKSDTYRKLLDDKTGLYHQSAGYVYSFLENEMQFGKAM